MSEVAIELTVIIEYSRPIIGNTVSRSGTNIKPPPIPNNPERIPVIKPTTNNNITNKISIRNT